MESEILCTEVSMSTRVLSICVFNESAARISSSKFLGSEHACSKPIAQMTNQMNVCFDKRMAVKLHEAVVVRGEESSKNQKRPRLPSTSLGHRFARSLIESIQRV
jgi:hypothetical protein